MLRSTEQKETVTIKSSQHRLTQIGIDTVSRSTALHRLIQLQQLLLQVHQFARGSTYVKPEEPTLGGGVSACCTTKCSPFFLNTYTVQAELLLSTPK